MTNEEWRPVLGYEGLYEVSSLGRVRSLSHVVPFWRGRRTVKSHILRAFIKRSTGYPAVALSNGPHKAQYTVHRLVLVAFRGAPLHGQEACHNNGNREDARLSNLRWDCRVNNAADRKLHGTEHQGAKSPSAKLTDDAVRTIRASNKPMLQLARQFGVSASAIKRVIERITWVHIE